MPVAPKIAAARAHRRSRHEGPRFLASNASLPVLDLDLFEVVAPHEVEERLEVLQILEFRKIHDTSAEGGAGARESRRLARPA